MRRLRRRRKRARRPKTDSSLPTSAVAFRVYYRTPGGGWEYAHTAPVVDGTVTLAPPDKEHRRPDEPAGGL